MLIARHHSTLPDAAQAPEWVHLMPAGTFRGTDGRGPYRLRDAQAVITASMAAGKLAIDENHATDFALTSGVASPARGWIVEMQARADGIWGRVEWTPSGTQLMADRAYRGISPVFEAAKADGTVLRVLRAALTNTPNLAQLHTLHHQQGTGMDFITRLRAALGLPETADEAAIEAAVQAGAAAVTAHATQLGAIAAAAGAPAADAQAIVTTLQTRLAGAGDVASLRQTVVELQTQLQTHQATAARERAVAFIDGAIRAGKPIAPLRDHYIARHAADPASVEMEIGALVSINAGGVPARRAGAEPDGDELTDEERTVAEKMGLDPKKFAEQKKKAGNAGRDGGTT